MKILFRLTSVRNWMVCVMCKSHAPVIDIITLLFPTTKPEPKDEEHRQLLDPLSILLPLSIPTAEKKSQNHVCSSSPTLSPNFHRHLHLHLHPTIPTPISHLLPPLAADRCSGKYGIGLLWLGLTPFAFLISSSFDLFAPILAQLGFHELASTTMAQPRHHLRPLRLLPPYCPPRTHPPWRREIYLLARTPRWIFTFNSAPRLASPSGSSCANSGC